MSLKGLRLAALGCVALFNVSAMGQDLIARQAPIDRKMQGVDSVALQRLVVKENGGIPSASLYPSWNNEHVNAYGNAVMPERFDIDLRGFAMPTDSRVVTSNFGPRWGRMHKGIDLKVYVGDTIRAAFAGKVRVVDYERRGYGNYIVIRHDNGLETVYGHLSKHLVRPNQVVEAGEVIGLGGNTGRSTGSHLHFETRLLGVAINPVLLFDFVAQDVTADVYTYQSGRSNSSRISVASVSQKNERETVNARNGVPRYHKVHKGETLSSIAKKYGLTVNQLCAKNGITRKSKLSIGQVLRCI